MVERFRRYAEADLVEPQEVEDWIEFCEGRKSFDRDHFSSMFMELYLEPFTESDKDNLRTILRFMPNSSALLGKMLRMDQCAEDKTDEQIVELVRRDLQEKRKLVDSAEALRAIDTNAIEITLDEDRFDEIAGEDVHGQFCHSLANFFMRHMSDCDDKTAALSNAFYGLASNAQLQSSLTSDLLDLDVDLDNYFELYLIGVDYALCADSVAVMNYRATMTDDD